MRTQPMVRRCEMDDCPQSEPVRQPEQPARRPDTEPERPDRAPSDAYAYGTLPPIAPLANPYVPFQRNNPKTYPAKQGVVRGTLFPGLDLPFMGMVNEAPLSDTCLHELQTLGFALVELGEYLDTHADDKDAFDLFRSYAALYQKGRAEYEKQHGPLTQRAAAEGDKYEWLKDPWPWDYAANSQEG